MKHWKEALRKLFVLRLILGLLGMSGMALAAEEPAKEAAPAAPGVAAPPAHAQATAATPAPPKPDPGGGATGGIGDLTAKVPGKPTLEEVADAAGHNKIAINMVWTLITGFLVMFMQAGFALVETGFCRAKNAAHTMMMNFMVYAIGMTGYWILGFALQMGGVGGSPLAGCASFFSPRRRGLGAWQSSLNDQQNLRDTVIQATLHLRSKLRRVVHLA